MAARVARAGTAPVRLMLAPARGLVRWPRAGGVMRSGVERMSATAGGVFETEAERAVDAVLAGPLPEAVARSLVARHVGERVANEVLGSADLEGIVAAATEDKRTERIMQQVLASPATERMLSDALESRLAVDLTERLLQSPELQRAVEDAVRAALARRTASLADQMAGAARHIDAALEAPVRRLLRRAPGPQAASSDQSAVPYAGLGTRAAALLVDGLAVHILFLTGSAMVVLLSALVGRNPPRSLAEVVAGVAWAVVVAVYFVSFWTAAGQTPGMRLMRLRVVDAAGAPPRVGRSVLRLIGAGVAVAFVFLGFLPVLVDGRRRALQDFLADTLVRYDDLGRDG
ncbi:MAG TPA: RDD family protein [Gaiellales bacterium]